MHYYCLAKQYCVVSVGSAKVKSVFICCLKFVEPTETMAGILLMKQTKDCCNLSIFPYFLKTTASAVFDILSSFQEGLSEVTAQHFSVCLVPVKDRGCLEFIEEIRLSEILRQG